MHSRRRVMVNKIKAKKRLKRRKAAKRQATS